MEYLTPNSLILGRTGQEGDMHGIDLETHPWHRLRAVQAGVNKFWLKWSELAGPNLFIQHKWHRAERNIQVGDLVWIADQNALLVISDLVESLSPIRTRLEWSGMLTLQPA